MQDNIDECRFRLLSIVKNEFKINITKNMVRIVLRNIVCTPFEKYKNGSLDYHFSFNEEPEDCIVADLFKRLI
jgi:hypothetical protein